ncbi:MAG: hypothetical protein INR66_01970 [Gordonia polyisoprenivorans]|nr:hypothetical protein [Gordonia polyisoprenivorans]
MQIRWGVVAVVAALTASTVFGDFRGSPVRAEAPDPVADVKPRCASSSVAGPLRLAVVGTSLTNDYTWPEVVAERLGQRVNREVELTRLARSGATSDWGRSAVAARPELAGVDVVLVEFLANDADLLEHMTVNRSRDNHRAIVQSIRRDRDACTGPAVVLMTMSPVHGLRGFLRLRLPTFEAMYGGLARETGSGLLNLRSRWDSGERFGDGLHPTDAQSNAVIPAAVIDYLAPAVRD